MIFELKKFYKTTPSIILLIFSIFLSIVMPLFFIHDYETCDYSSGKEKVVSGMEGLEMYNSKINKISGPLTNDRVDEMLSFYKSLPDKEESYYKMENEYPGILILLNQAYAPYGSENSFNLKTIDNSEEFNIQNINKVKSKIDRYGFKYLPENEEKIALEKAENIEKPFMYKFIEQWPILIKSLIFVYFIIVALAIVVSSNLFSFEKEQNMKLILNAMGNKRIISIGIRKIMGMIFYLSCIFFSSTIISFLIVLISIGTSGWNIQIQMIPEFFSMIYDWSIGEMMINYVIIAWLSIISIALIGALVNSITQKTFLTFTLMIFLVFFPMSLKNSLIIPYSIKKIFQVFPINGVNLLGFIDSLSSYNFGGVSILSSTMILIVSISISVTCLIASPILFYKRNS